MAQGQAGSKLRVSVRRSQLGQVRGLGAAHAGVGHWWGQRVSAAALVPLTVWFVWAVLGLLGAGQAQAAHWAGEPWNAVLLLCLIGATFYHLVLGLQTVIEDYIHTEMARMVSLLLIKGAAVLLALAGALAVLKLAVMPPV